jgi:hypothetical protein
MCDESVHLTVSPSMPFSSIRASRGRSHHSKKPQVKPGYVTTFVKPTRTLVANVCMGWNGYVHCQSLQAHHKLEDCTCSTRQQFIPVTDRFRHAAGEGNCRTRRRCKQLHCDVSGASHDMLKKISTCIMRPKASAGLGSELSGGGSSCLSLAASVASLALFPSRLAFWYVSTAMACHIS